MRLCVPLEALAPSGQQFPRALEIVQVSGVHHLQGRPLQQAMAERTLRLAFCCGDPMGPHRLLHLAHHLVGSKWGAGVA